MSLLATILPLLANGSQFNFNVSKVNGALRIVTNPIIENFQPDTEDEELAAIQSALVMPVVFTIPLETDLDATLAILLKQAQSIRQPNLDRFSSFNAAQLEAQNAAKLAKDKKDEKAAATAAAKNTKSNDKVSKPSGTGITVAKLAGENSDENNGNDEKDNDENEIEANTDASTSPENTGLVVPAPSKKTIDLFETE